MNNIDNQIISGLNFFLDKPIMLKKSKGHRYLGCERVEFGKDTSLYQIMENVPTMEDICPHCENK